MTLTKSYEGTLIHYPNNKERFEFDGDVAECFDDMAERSIPLYAESHRLHAYLAYEWIKAHKYDIKIADIGASTGGFFAALHRAAWTNYHDEIPHVKLHALDVSRPMLDKINEKLPCVGTYEQDVCSMASMGEEYDMVNMSYVLQFLKGGKKNLALREIRSSMKSGGLLFLSQKEDVPTRHAPQFQDHYIDFRLENDYTPEEVEAKTRALKGSMFPDSQHKLYGMLQEAGFNEIQETSRWLQFSSLVAVAY